MSLSSAKMRQVCSSPSQRQLPLPVPLLSYHQAPELWQFATSTRLDQSESIGHWTGVRRHATATLVIKLASSLRRQSLHYSIASEPSISHTQAEWAQYLRRSTTTTTTATRKRKCRQCETGQDYWPLLSNGSSRSMANRAARDSAASVAGA